MNKYNERDLVEVVQGDLPLDDGSKEIKLGYVTKIIKNGSDYTYELFNACPTLPDIKIYAEIDLKLASYDHRKSTFDHIKKVEEYLNEVRKTLTLRGANHDQSKLREPEFSVFQEVLSGLKNKDYKYGTPEYAACLKDLQPALVSHYSQNDHHPEHFPLGIEAMNLFQLFEMLCDWKAAGERAIGGSDILTSLKVNYKRHNISNMTIRKLYSTVLELAWCDRDLEFEKEIFIS